MFQKIIVISHLSLLFWKFMLNIIEWYIIIFLYSYRDIHYIPRTYLSQNWKIISSGPNQPFPRPQIPPLSTANPLLGPVWPWHYAVKRQAPETLSEHMNMWTGNNMLCVSEQLRWKHVYCISQKLCMYQRCIWGQLRQSELLAELT